MSLSRRRLLAVSAAAFVAPAGIALAEPGAAPASLIRQFYADLLAVMKQSKQLTFDQRYGRLAPAIARTFDLPRMTRIAVGPDWTQLSPSQQQRLDAAFARYTISTYANRFDGYSGERFEVTPVAAPNPNGVIVDTRLIKSNGEAVTLNYLMSQSGGSWQVIDVYLSGTVSELAARRSEFVAVLRRSGADGLVQMIEQRTAALRAS